MVLYDDLLIDYDSLSAAYDGGAVGMAPWTVEVAYSANPYDPISSMVWTDITPWVRSGDTKTGKVHELDQVQAGGAKFLIDNRDGRFSPWSTSPYALHTLLPIRVQATWDATYPVWFGYVTAVPVQWADAVNCDIEVAAIDIFKLLALDNLTSTPLYTDTVLADSPIGYYRCGDAPRTPTLTDSSGHGRTAGLLGAATFGVAGAIINDKDTAIDLGMTGARAAIRTPATAAPSGAAAITVELWLRLPQTLTVDELQIWSLGDAFTSAGASLEVDHTTGVLTFNTNNGFGSWNCSSTVGYLDSAWHHVVATRASDGRTMNLYVDGVLQETTVSGVAVTIASSFLWVGADVDGVQLFAGQVDEIATYSTELSAGQVEAHYMARLGYAQQLSGARVSAVLDNLGWAAADRDIAVGSSQIQAPTTSLTETTALSYLQQVETTEDGLWFQAPDGKVTFYGRDHKLTNSTSTTSQVTVGGAAGSEPYRLDGSQLGEDDLDIWNEAQVSRVGGSTQTVVDATSEARYRKRTWKPQSDLLCATDAECYDRANWVITHNATPLTRVGSLPVDPRSDPSVLWPLVLGLGLQDRVTFSRPMADGTTLTTDQLIEGVAHRFTPSTWLTTWNLDAADTQTYWVWGTSKWGQTTRWAY